ncbi:hypothetical protein DC74_7388 [Streptomyces noursei]|nr:hypothetical protein DC74_7388 [Streptomyces noursei]
MALGRAHPRGCGERAEIVASTLRKVGSSPRVRGAGVYQCAYCDSRGLIPAGAGSGRLGSSTTVQTGAHPRGCGERTQITVADALTAGSSPRVRGAGPGRLDPDPLRGLIPAGAGSGADGPAGAPQGRAHPRGCGERARGAWILTRFVGSSPRVRGAGLAIRRPKGRGGLIPAGAGSGALVATSRVVRRAHPRGCGERNAARSYPPIASGSSPRVRGAGDTRHRAVGGPGLIPAGAGSGDFGMPKPCVCWAHPRGCGERSLLWLAVAVTAGSSPRVRGADGGSTSCVRRGGLIPAGAGSGTRADRAAPKTRAHPRGCGERTAVMATAGSTVGSSPRVRGAGSPTVRARAPTGLIPAGAGSGSSA